MINTTRTAAALTLLLAGTLGVFTPASAQIVVGGTTSGTKLPFGTDGSTGTIINYAGEYQQLYSASAFSAPVAITAISFASATDPSGLGLSIPETATYSFVVGLSNTSASVSAPSTTFSSNLGANFTTVFSGTVTATLLANNTFDLTIPFTTPFVYTPGLPGSPNLLLDVFINSAKSSSQTDLFQNGNSGQSSRVFYTNGSSNPQTDQNGLRTRFTVTPEPSSLLVLALGAGCLAVTCRLKATRRQSNA